MDELYSPNCTEYTYEKKARGAMKFARFLLVIAYVLFALIYFIVCYKTRVLPIFALCPLFTWRYVSFDVYYTFERAELEFGKVRVKKKRLVKTPIDKISVREATIIARYSSVDKSRIPSKVFDLTAESSATEQLLIVYNKNGKARAVVLEATPKFVKLLKSYSEDLR